MEASSVGDSIRFLAIVSRTGVMIGLPLSDRAKALSKRRFKTGAPGVVS